MNLTLLSYLGLKIPEEVSFSTLLQEDDFELRLYERMVCAKVVLENKSSLKDGIQILNDYLEGNNFKVDHITRTGPSFKVFKHNSLETGIILPSYLSSSSAPKPINRQVKIEEWPAARFGVLCLEGDVSDRILSERAEDLKIWLASNGYRSFGAMRTLEKDYNIPLSFFKSQEIQLEVVSL